MKIKLICIFIFVILLTNILQINAQDRNETSIALEEAREAIQKTNSSNFKIVRVTDILITAEQLFEAQNALEERKGDADYSLVIERTEEIKNILKQQLETADELTALEEVLVDVGDKSMAFKKFEDAKKEFQNERYEKIPELIEEAYQIIEEEKAIETKVRSFYAASSKSVIDFFIINWMKLTASALIIMLLYLFTHKRIKTFFINRKIKNLEFEKEILQKIIKKSQDEYFHLFKIPQELYYIRVKKFGELIRDIERQVPLLIEERERLNLKPREKEKNKEKEDVEEPKGKKEEKEQIPKELEIIKKPIQEIEVHKKSKLFLIIKNIFSHKKLKEVLREIKKERQENKNRKLIEKRKRESEELMKRGEKIRMNEIARLTGKRERERKREERIERFIKFKRKLHEWIGSIFFRKRHIRLSKSGEEVLRKLRVKKTKKLKDISKELNDKERDYIHLLIEERYKKKAEQQTDQESEKNKKKSVKK